jgi:hypothetical protein
MSAVERIQQVLDAGLLMPQLIVVPTTGATEDEVDAEGRLLGRPLRPDHARILRRWNGLDLEVVRLFGCGENAGEAERLSARQAPSAICVGGTIAIGADPSGFVYLQSNSGLVFSFDSDGCELNQVATDLDDFFERLVFGPDAASFAGEDWLTELREAGIVD